jgi:hypothetical protein
MKFYLIIFCLLISLPTFSQSKNKNLTFNFKNSFFVSTSVGIQISGIKKEDFIIDNVAPAFVIATGTWLTSQIGLKLSYQGPYFYYIADDDKHPYYFIFAEALLNASNIVNKQSYNKKKWSLILHSGPGYFYNNYFKQASLNINLGILNNIKLNEHFDLFTDVSFVVGWDIYQGDEDILPSFVFGVAHHF